MSEVKNTISEEAIEATAYQSVAISPVKKRGRFWYWSMTFFLIVSSGVVARFFFDGRSLFDEWALLGSQLAVVAVLSLPAGLLITKLSRGCIVCRDDVCSVDNIKVDK